MIPMIDRQFVHIALRFWFKNFSHRSIDFTLLIRENHLVTSHVRPPNYTRIWVNVRVDSTRKITHPQLRKRAIGTRTHNNTQYSECCTLCIAVA